MTVPDSVFVQHPSKSSCEKETEHVPAFVGSAPDSVAVSHVWLVPLILSSRAIVSPGPHVSHVPAIALTDPAHATGIPSIPVCPSPAGIEVFETTVPIS